MHTLIGYHSFYGSTKEYAQECAQRLGALAQPIEEVIAQVAADPTATVILFAPTHAGQSEAVKAIPKLKLASQPVAVVTVGMTLLDELRASDPMARPLGELADRVKRFYLPGRMNYSELSGVHRAAMWTIHQMLKAKKNKSANEQAMFDDYNLDVSRMNFGELDPIVAWAKSVSQ